MGRGLQRAKGAQGSEEDVDVPSLVRQDSRYIPYEANRPGNGEMVRLELPLRQAYSTR